MLHVHCTRSGTQEPSITSSAFADSALSAIETLAEHQENLADSPAPKHLCAANVGTKSARHFGVVMQTILAPTEHARWAKWRGDRAEATGQRARPKADGQSCTLATPRGTRQGGPLTGGFSKLPGRHLVAFWRVLGQGVNIPDNTQKLEATILIRLVRRGAGVFGLSAAVAVPTHAPKLSAFGPNSPYRK